MRISAGYFFMQKQKFTKFTTTIDEQITLLKERGLQLQDESFVYHCLSTVNYYRLSAYFKPYEINKSSHKLHYTLKEQIGLLILFNNVISLHSTWINRLRKIFEKHMTKNVSAELMGFDINWQKDAIWKM